MENQGIAGGRSSCAASARHYGHIARRLMAAGLDPTRAVQVALDFDRESRADTRAKSGMDMRARTAVIWEGVTNYLTADAVYAVLNRVSSLAAGSTLAFTHVHSDVPSHPEKFVGADRILRSVATAGEAWTYGIHPARLRGRLQSLGLKLVEDLGANDYRSRYWRSAQSRWRGYAFYRAALAVVPNHAEA